MPTEKREAFDVEIVVRCWAFEVAEVNSGLPIPLRVENLLTHILEER